MFEPSHRKLSHGSADYWITRYRRGGKSGAGSYSKFAEFKATVLNEFVKENAVNAVIEYGCGDGNQLTLAQYPSYIGFDVSPDAVALCQDIFADDKTKSFRLVNAYDGEKADLTLSLDVVYHLIEDDIFFSYMDRLFDSSTRFVIVYSSNTNEQLKPPAAHVMHRKFTDWVEQNKPDWKLLRHIPNKYPYTGNHREGSFADFYIYAKK